MNATAPTDRGDSMRLRAELATVQRERAAFEREVIRLRAANKHLESQLAEAQRRARVAAQAGRRP